MTARCGLLCPKCFNQNGVRNACTLPKGHRYNAPPCNCGTHNTPPVPPPPPPLTPPKVPPPTLNPAASYPTGIPTQGLTPGAASSGGTPRPRDMPMSTTEDPPTNMIISPLTSDPTPWHLYATTLNIYTNTPTEPGATPMEETPTSTTTTQLSPPPRMSPGVLLWQLFVCPTTNRLWYHNTVTMKAHWALNPSWNSYPWEQGTPPGLHWELYSCPQTNRLWYHNTQTQEAHWAIYPRDIHNTQEEGA